VDLGAITAWLESLGVLNVAGSRESKSVGIYAKAFSLLVEVLRQDECREPLIVQ